jgi:Flp pilus assembly protein TadG
MNLFPRHRSGREQHGQTLVMFAVLLAFIVLFTGLAIDFGFAYLTRAKLAKAVDAACLNAARSYSKTDDSLSQGIAKTAFKANYGTYGPPTISVSSTTDPNNAATTLLNCTATATNNTFFARILPTWSTVSVTAGAQSKHATLVMTLVLDRSGSMTSNGGWRAATGAIPKFVAHFDDLNDYVGLVSFANYATVDVPITTAPGNFKTAILTALGHLSANGSTFTLGGLRKGIDQDGVPHVDGNVFKAIVLLTDGKANVIDDNLSCPGYSSINYGGADAGSSVTFMDPNTGGTVCTVNGTGDSPSCCAATLCTCNPATVGPCTTGAGTQKCFMSSAYGNTYFPFVRNWVSTDARTRTLNLAGTYRGDPTNPTTFYTIGLGTSIDFPFLQQMANDPSYAAYNSAQPAGLAIQIASCDSASTTCDLQVQQAFETIAANILLRLTQ